MVHFLVLALGVRDVVGISSLTIWYGVHIVDCYNLVL